MEGKNASSGRSKVFMPPEWSKGLTLARRGAQVVLGFRAPMSSLADFDEPEIHSDVDRMRHSCAHVMAHAISRLWPTAKFGIGPTIEAGFYYDVELPVKLTPEDLPKIEKEMANVI